MSERHDKLRSSLTELQAHLDELRAVDPEVAAHLDATIQQARAVLDSRAPQSAEQNESVVDELSEALIKYEASHPTLAGTLRSMIDALAQMGI